MDSTPEPPRLSIPSSETGAHRDPVGASIVVGLLGLGFLAFMGSYFLYRVSLHLHSHFGEIFKSVFDVFRDKISIDEIINDLTQITENPELTKLPCKDRFKIAWRYLHNYRIKVKDGQVVPPHLFQKQKMDNK
jgi:hypothetical protein